MESVVKDLPQYDYVYLGDTKRVPYGNRPQEEIYAFTKQGVDYLINQKCSLVLLFCNTASAQALRKLQAEKYRVLGVIIPTVEEVTGNVIGVLATQSTVDSATYVLELKKVLPNAKVFQQSAPGLVPMIEAGEIDNELIASYVRPLLDKGIDTLILGCTHYPIIKTQIKRLLPNTVRLVSQDEFIAKKLKNFLDRHPEIETKLSKNKKRTVILTSSPDFTAW